MAVPIGVLIHATHQTNPTPYLTPWSGRGGNAGVFVADVIALNLTAGDQKVVITVQTKNSEDADDNSQPSSQDLGSFENITSVPSTPPTKYLSGFKELYRYKIRVFGSVSSDWAHMRMLRPSWITN